MIPPTLQFLMIVEDPAIAAYVAESGVNRLFVDLEVMGKEARQPGLDTVKSAQTIETVARIRAAVPDGHVLVRVNPWHDGTPAEVADAIAAGADSLMLPMFRDRDTLARFFDTVADRAEVVPLFETVGALNALPGMVGDLPLTGLHFGLNDLHLERGDRMMFAPIAEGVLEQPAEALRAAGIRFGIGGVARAGEGQVPPELILGEHVRLGSTAAILSRSFHRRATSLSDLQAGMDFPAEIAKLGGIYDGFRAADTAALAGNRQAFRAAVAAL